MSPFLRGLLVCLSRTGERKVAHIKDLKLGLFRVKEEIFAWRVREGTAAEELFVEPQFDESGRAFVEVYPPPSSRYNRCFSRSLSFPGGGKEKDGEGKGESDETRNGQIDDQAQRLSPYPLGHHLLLWLEGAPCPALPTAGGIKSRQKITRSKNCFR